MLTQLLLQIIDWLCSAFVLALLARVLMQKLRVPFRNPLGQFIIALTDWAVIPARRIIPSGFGLDLPSLVLAWLAQLLFHAMLLAAAASLPGPGALLLLALLAVLALIKTMIYLVMGIIIIGALLTWVNPHAPLAPLMFALGRPFLAPLQRRLPLVGGVDLSPLALLIIAQILLAILGQLEFSLLPGMVWR